MSGGRRRNVRTKTHPAMANRTGNPVTVPLAERAVKVPKVTP